MTFSNSFTISVQFGQFNYCDRRTILDSLEDFDRIERDAELQIPVVSSPTAEVAIWQEVNVNTIGTSNWVNFSEDGEQVRGWCTTDQVAEMIAVVSTAESLREIESKLQTLKLTI